MSFFFETCPDCTFLLHNIIRRNLQTHCCKTLLAVCLLVRNTTIIFTHQIQHNSHCCCYVTLQWYIYRHKRTLLYIVCGWKCLQRAEPQQGEMDQKGRRQRLKDWGTKKMADFNGGWLTKYRREHLNIVWTANHNLLCRCSAPTVTQRVFNPVLMKLEGQYYRFLFVINGFKLGTALCSWPFLWNRGHCAFLSLFVQPGNLAGMKGKQHGAYISPISLLLLIYFHELVICVVFPASFQEVFNSH